MKQFSQVVGRWAILLALAVPLLHAAATRSLAQAPKERVALKGHKGRVNHVAFAPDGKTLASAGADGTVRRWDLTNNQELTSWKGPISHWRHVTFGADGKTLTASGGSDETEGAIVHWDVATAKDHVLYQGRLRMSAAALTKAGDRVAGVGEVGVMKMWDVATAKELTTFKNPTKDNNDDICAIEFSDDEKTLITGSWDGTVRFWDVASAKNTAVIDHDSSVWGLAISKDKKTLAVGSQQGMIYQWDVATRAKRGDVFRHPKKVWSLAYSPDGAVLASASVDGSWKLWDSATGKELASVKEPAICVAFSPDGKTLAVGRREGTIKLWDVAIEAK
jgi:WD40 repeat protein